MCTHLSIQPRLLTPAVLGDWSDAGRNALFVHARQFFVADGDTVHHHTTASARVSGVRTLLYEVMMAGMQAQLSPVQVAEFCYLLHTTVANQPCNTRESPFQYVGPYDTDDQLCIPSLLVDIICILDIPSDLKPASISSDPSSTLLMQRRSRLVDITKKIIIRNFIPNVIFTERLEIELLGAVNLVTNSPVFSRKIIRTNTMMLYKQSKFNLLREESEGYSKLLMELTCSLPRPLDVYWEADKSKLSHAELSKLRKTHIHERALTAIRNIQSLIGSFDLDPNRVLDIVLDVFTANVLDYWDFFVEMLLQGPWKPRIVKKTIKKRVRNADGSGMSDVDVQVESTEGRDVVGQILGFKFQFYNQVDVLQPTPQQLVWVAAILIKHKVVQLSHLYAHLNSPDASHSADYDDYLKELKAKCSTAGRYATTALSGSLGGDDGSLPASSLFSVEAETNKPSKPKLPDQKGALASALIAIGDLSSARTILDRLPHLASMYSDIPENMCRALQVVVEDIDSTLRPLHSSKITRKPVPSIDKYPPPVNTLSPKLLFSFDSVHMGRKIQPVRQQFFYHLWKDGIPRASDYASAFRIIKTLLTYVGPNLYLDPCLMSKIIRIGRVHIEHTHSNPGLAQDLWLLVKLWPYTTRYALYGEWKHVTYKRTPELEVALFGCQKDCRYIMARLSKETIKQYGRHIAKVAHSNPVIAFSYILKQLESYDNMISVVVDASRYLTDLEFDVMSFCLIEALADRKKQRVEANGTYISPWLKSLSVFTGMLFRRHDVEMTGMLQYIANQLASDNVYDLIVLQEIISSMSGVKPLDDATELQLDALAGGDTVRREALIIESLRLTRKPTGRLVEALVQSKLAMPIGLLIARQRKEIIFCTNTDELKILGWLNDYCQCKFLLYFDFLSSNLPIDVYTKGVPSMNILVRDYGLDMEVAFHILRPVLSHTLRTYAIKLAKNSNTKPIAQIAAANSTDNPGNSLMALDVKMDVDLLPDTGAAIENVESTGDIKGEAGQPQCLEAVAPPTLSGHPMLSDLKATVMNILPASTFSDMSPSFYVTFWQLSLYDIYVPAQRGHHQAQTRKGAKTAAPTKAFKELRTQQYNFDLTQERLNVEKLEWFAQNAIYCGKFISLLHSLGTLNLSTVSLYDNIFNKDCLHATIFALTEVEARNYGLFLAVNLQVLSIWHGKKEVYEKEGKGDGLPGFLCRWPTGRALFSRAPNDDIMDYEQFRRAMSKWHLKLRKAFLDALQSKEYVQIRNAILILDKLIENFPATKEVGMSIQKVVKSIEETESRNDLKQLARSYFAKMYSKEKSWIPVNKFSDQHLQPMRQTVAPLAPLPSSDVGSPIVSKASSAIPDAIATSLTPLSRVSPTVMSVATPLQSSATTIEAFIKSDMHTDMKESHFQPKTTDGTEDVAKLEDVESLSLAAAPDVKSLSLASMDVDLGSVKSEVQYHAPFDQPELPNHHANKSLDNVMDQSRSRDRNRDSGRSWDTLRPQAAALQDHRADTSGAYSTKMGPTLPEMHRNNMNVQGEDSGPQPLKLERSMTSRSGDTRLGMTTEASHSSNKADDHSQSSSSWRKNESERSSDRGRNRDRDPDWYNRSKDRDRRGDSSSRRGEGGVGHGNSDSPMVPRSGANPPLRRDTDDRASGRYDQGKDGRQRDRLDALQRDGVSGRSSEASRSGPDVDAARDVRDRGSEAERDAKRNGSGGGSIPPRLVSDTAERPPMRRGGARDSREGRDNRDNRDSRDGRNSRESRAGRGNHDVRDDKDTRDIRDTRDAHVNRYDRDGRDARIEDDAWTRKDVRGRDREVDARDVRDSARDVRFREDRDKDRDRDRDRRPERESAVIPRQHAFRNDGRDARGDVRDRHENSLSLQKNYQHENARGNRTDQGDKTDRTIRSEQSRDSAASVGGSTSLDLPVQPPQLRSALSPLRPAASRDYFGPDRSSSSTSSWRSNSALPELPDDSRTANGARAGDHTSSQRRLSPPLRQPDSQGAVDQSRDVPVVIHVESSAKPTFFPEVSPADAATAARSTILDRLGGRSQSSLQSSTGSGQTESDLDRRKRNRDEPHTESSRHPSAANSTIEPNSLKAASHTASWGQTSFNDLSAQMQPPAMPQEGSSGGGSNDPSVSRGNKRVRIVRK
ncbi:hypothetical protein BSLG_009518 [Batrachochytrium salamandrivorans]|nr:hypothetical protein BSLG_009518 [Batrachochytrium salamandrivorans]